jgi:cytochrome P450
VQLVGRVVYESVELGGAMIEPGERVVAYLGAGDRDPRRFAEPERLDLDRTDNAPLSFGGGIQFCLGAPLARLEARIAFPALLGRFQASSWPGSRSGGTASHPGPDAAAGRARFPCIRLRQGNRTGSLRQCGRSCS